MSKLDERLQIVQELLQAGQLSAEAGKRLGARPDGSLSVLVQFSGGLEPLQSAGFALRSRFSDVASGNIPVAQLDALAAVDTVQRIEAAYVMSRALDVSLPEARGNTAHSPGIGAPPTAYRGAGVIVGIIDTGIDWTHPAFRRPDGTSRVLRIWDQFLTPAAGESSPAGYTYGVEYTQTQINAVLANPAAAAPVRHQDNDGHGSHVAGIAAGNGRAPGTFVGVAPDADLIVVSNMMGNNDFGDSVQTADAIRYIYAQAAALNRPVVINQSQGVNVGPHDGTTLLERAINDELGFPGRSYVVAAGNAANDVIATRGSVPSGGGTATEQFVIPAGDRFVDTIDIWYPGSARLDIVVTDPAGNSTPALVAPAGTPGVASLPAHALPGGNRVAIRSRTDDTFNRDNRIYIQILRGTAATIASGTWAVTLTNNQAQATTYDAWIERILFTNPATGFADPIPAWASPTRPTEGTITIPATAREAIAVGSYITKDSTGANPGAAFGTISSFSGRGPTRDGRIKPDLTAPGEWIMSVQSSAAPAGTTDASGTYQLMQGTSMAAPHVAGAVALILEKNPTLRQEQIRAGLTATARSDGQTAAVPNNTWGHGKMDVAAAVARDYPAFQTRNWVRIRTLLYNWTEGDLPPVFDISANENGQAIIELAWDPQAMLAPSTGYVPLRYYNTGQALDVNVTRADGGNMHIQLPPQTIQLVNNNARWEMPQALWDGYRQELRKARAGQSAMSPNIYYRVRFNPTGGTSALIWPPDASFQNDPNAQRVRIIALSSAPQTQVVPDQAALDAMGLWGPFVRWLWEHLPADNADRQSLAAVFSHRFFTNEVETAVRGKILMLWLFGGPHARQRIPDLLDTQFRTAAGLEMTIFKQRDLRDNTMLIDHLLALLAIVPHPDLPAVVAAEQLVDDALTEIMDPNGQTNQGQASTCGLAALQTLLININAAEYARLLRGLLSSAGSATLANGDTVDVPAGIYQVARYAGLSSLPFYVRTNSELGFQATMLKYALGGAFPDYDPSAAADAPNGINTVFQATMRRGVTAAQLERALEGLLGRAHNTDSEAAPSDGLRNRFIQRMAQVTDPLLLIVHWNAPASDAAHTALHSVVALRSEAGRVFFKNPQYAGSTPPTGATANSSTTNPPRRLDDPAQALESMGDNDLAQWIRWYHHPA